MNGEKILLFRDLQPDQIDRIMNLAREEKVPAGEIIIQEGEKGNALYILKEGTVDILKSIVLKVGEGITQNKVKRLARLRAEDGVFFGEMAFIGEEERSATVKAVTDCTLLAIERRDFEKVASQDCKLAYTIMVNIAKILSHRLKQANEDIAKLTTALSIAISSRIK